MKKFIFLFLPAMLFSQSIDLSIDYVKYEYRIPMRDGATLHTAVYVPKDTSKRYPIMLSRTPYTTAPYGEKYLKAEQNNAWMAQEGYIMAFQDVRGRFMSEGEYEDIRPHIPNKQSKQQVDESSSKLAQLATQPEAVNPTAELANLMVAEQSGQASVKVVKAADEMMGTLLDVRV